MVVFDVLDTLFNTVKDAMALLPYLSEAGKTNGSKLHIVTISCPT